MPLSTAGLSRSCLQCTPDSLPSNILEQLGSWVAQNSTLLEGEPAGHAVRCAVCVHAPQPQLACGSSLHASLLSRFGPVGDLAVTGSSGSPLPSALPQARRAPAACRSPCLHC